MNNVVRVWTKHILQDSLLPLLKDEIEHTKQRIRTQQEQLSRTTEINEFTDQECDLVASSIYHTLKQHRLESESVPMIITSLSILKKSQASTPVLDISYKVICTFWDVYKDKVMDHIHLQPLSISEKYTLIECMEYKPISVKLPFANITKIIQYIIQLMKIDIINKNRSTVTVKAKVDEREELLLISLTNIKRLDRLEKNYKWIDQSLQIWSDELLRHIESTLPYEINTIITPIMVKINKIRTEIQPKLQTIPNIKSLQHEMKQHLIQRYKHYNKILQEKIFEPAEESISVYIESLRTQLLTRIQDNTITSKELKEEITSQIKLLEQNPVELLPDDTEKQNRINYIDLIEQSRDRIALHTMVDLITEQISSLLAYEKPIFTQVHGTNRSSLFVNLQSLDQTIQEVIQKTSSDESKEKQDQSLTQIRDQLLIQAIEKDMYLSKLFFYKTLDASIQQRSESFRGILQSDQSKTRVQTTLQQSGLFSNHGRQISGLSELECAFYWETNINKPFQKLLNMKHSFFETMFNLNTQMIKVIQTKEIDLWKELESNQKKILQSISINHKEQSSCHFPPYNTNAVFCYVFPLKGDKRKDVLMALDDICINNKQKTRKQWITYINQIHPTLVYHSIDQKEQDKIEIRIQQEARNILEKDYSGDYTWNDFMRLICLMTMLTLTTNPTTTITSIKTNNKHPRQNKDEQKELGLGDDETEDDDDQTEYNHKRTRFW